MLDFDGTVTEKDIGDEVCDRFAPPAWRDIDAAWVRNEISLPDAQRQMWAMARAERHDALAYAREIGHLRPGLDALLDRGAACAARRSGWRRAASISTSRRCSARGSRRFERRYFNATRFIDGRIEVEFPHAAHRLRALRGVQGQGVRRGARRADGRRVFIGDGASDRCAIGRADRIFAVRGSLLERVCEERGAEHVPFDDFAEIARAL